MPAVVSSRNEPSEIVYEQSRIDCQIEDAGRERQPRLLESPKGPQSSTYPDVVPPFSRDCAGEFRDHQPGRQAPDQRSQQNQHDGTQIPGGTYRLLKAVWSPRCHEIGSGDQRPKSNPSLFSGLWIAAHSRKGKSPDSNTRSYPLETTSR